MCPEARANAGGVTASSCTMTSYMKCNVTFVRYEIFTAVSTKNGVVWDITPCDSCKNRRSGGT
jgi:hypothetical protein